MQQTMYRDAISQAIAEEMRRDEKVFVMGEDVALIGGIYKATRGLLEEFGPLRVRDTPLSEIAIAGAATGAAMAGARPIAEIMHIDFMLCCLEIVGNQMAKMCYKSNGAVRVPLVLRTQGGRGRSNSCTQSQSLESLVTHFPGLKVVMPCTPCDAKGLLKSAIRDDNPVVFIEHKGLYQTTGEIPQGEHLIELGRADVKRSGRDLTIISWSKTVLTALDAARTLAEKGIDAEVIDLRTLVPLDFDTIAGSVKKTGRVIVTHEAVERGGYGAEVAAQIQEKLFDELDAPILRVCGDNIPVPSATQPEIESAPTPQKLVAAAMGIC
jgi:pyruvate/2-oxoglutarate/acetoin dehydrogenase E1 component